MIRARLADKEAVQKLLEGQRAETEAAHAECQAKLRELQANEEVLASARSALAQVRAMRMEAEAAHSKSLLDLEVQNMVKSSGANVELVRIREGTYVV